MTNECIFSPFKSADELASLVGAAVHKWGAQNRKLVPEEEKIAELDLKQYREAVSKRDLEENARRVGSRKRMPSRKPDPR